MCVLVSSQPMHVMCMCMRVCLSVCPCVPSFPVWCRSVDSLFGYPTYEVSASYVEHSEEVDMRCQPGGGGVEFRKGNLSDILSFTIESGPHGNIQLLPPGVGPCVYRITVSWGSPSSVHLSMSHHLASSYT